MGIIDWLKNKFAPSSPSKDRDRPESIPRIKTTKLDFPVSLIKGRMLVMEASRWVGIREVGGNNSGQMVEMFQRALDGKAAGEAWCLAFIQFCVIAVEDQAFAMDVKELKGHPAEIYPTEHCLNMWNHTPESRRRKTPSVGNIVVWQHMNKDGKGTSSGHVGIVVKVLSDGTFDTIEGNTSGGASGNVNREGDGVMRKNRSVRGAGRMKVKGFIQVWV